MKKWTIELTEPAERQLRADFNAGVISKDDIKILKRWINDIEDFGLEFAQHKADWRDHELSNEWKGHRAISFSYAGRLIYRTEDNEIVVYVVKVTAKHDYKK